INDDGIVSANCSWVILLAQAFLYAPGGDPATYLGPKTTAAWAINNPANHPVQIVGDGIVGTFIYEVGGSSRYMADLLLLQPLEPIAWKWELQHASAINDSGLIVGSGLATA